MNSGANSGGHSDAASSLLGDRYQIVRELGRGGFGQTYLAEDLHRYKELCVIKEFIPQIQDKAVLNKAKELFEREANTLYQLDHKQIPEFRQLLQVETETGGRLFLVQDYVEGPTYQHLLQERQKFGGHFNETEITQLLYQLLPVLSYIHNIGIVHRDISPDNLISRRSDGLPVLIDFGSVKEIAAAVRSQLSIEGVGSDVTRIGKVGYVPQEQLSTGQSDAASDLYGLGATLLVLANGKDPQVLHDTYHGGWNGFDVLSPKLGAIVEKMLQADPASRFQSAEEVIAALSGSEAIQRSPAVGSSDLYPSAGPSAGPSIGTAAPVERASQAVFDQHMHSEAIAYDDNTVVPISAVSGRPPDPEISSTYETTLAESSVHEPTIEDEIERREERQALIPLLIMLGVLATLLLFGWFRLRRPTAPVIGGTQDPAVSENVSNTGGFSLTETERQQEIRDRREALGIGENTFIRIVDQLFYAEYPTLRTSGPDGGRKALTSAPEDEPLRIRWNNTALGLLSKLEDNFSARSLENLNNYSENDRARWQSDVNAVNVGTRSLYDLTDAKFFSIFPEQTGRDFLQEPTGQLYYAIADDRARAIADGTLTENVSFAESAYSKTLDGRLGSGNGKIYTVQLTSGQVLRLNLNANTNDTLLSIYPPNSLENDAAIIEDSEQVTWSGEVTRSGLYEVVVVNQSLEATDYELTLAVDRVSSEPPVAPEKEELPPVLDEDSSGENNSAEDADSTEVEKEDNSNSNNSDDTNSVE